MTTRHLQYPKPVFEVEYLNNLDLSRQGGLPAAPLLPGLAELLIEMSDEEPEVEARYFRYNEDRKLEPTNLTIRVFYPGDEDMECVVEIRELADSEDELDAVDYFQMGYNEVLVKLSEWILRAYYHDEAGEWFVTEIASRQVADHLVNRNLAAIQKRAYGNMTDSSTEAYRCPFHKYVKLLRSRPRLPEAYSDD